MTVGDEAVLMGEAGSQRITAGDLGSLAQTISYEVLCTVGKLVRRVYRDRSPEESIVSSGERLKSETE